MEWPLVIHSDRGIQYTCGDYEKATEGMERMFFVKHFSLKKASKFPFFSKGISLLSARLLEGPQASL